MRIITLSPNPDKCALLRLAFTNLRTQTDFSFSFNKVNYTFTKNQANSNLRYDLTMINGNHKSEQVNLTRKEVMAFYFKQEKLDALKNIPDAPEGLVFWQING